MRYLGVMLSFLLTVGCATSPDGKNSPEGAGDITAPTVIYKVEPDYPAELRREGVTGEVTIEATIDKSGRLLNPRVLRSSDPRLEDLALAAVRQWQFKPGTLNGEAIDVLFQVEVRFSIP